MESESASNFNKTPAPLFPAYSSNVQNQKEKKEDWLYNSSFTESAFKQASILNLHCAEVAPQDVIHSPVQETSTIQVKKLKKSHKRKKYGKGYDPSAFSVPESESVLFQLKKKTFIEDTGLSFERAFHTDATRDPENLMFEHFEKTKIANYFVRLKFPAGLTKEELLLWTLNLPKKISKENPRYFSKKFLKTVKTMTSEEVSVIKEPLKSGAIEFIPISVVPSKNFAFEQVESVPTFMNVSSSWKTVKPEKKQEIDPFSSTVSSEDYMRDKVIFYNKTLTDNPGDIKLWLDFVDFQDKLQAPDKEADRKGSVLSENSIIEKKLAILEKALKYNPKDISLNVTKLKLSRSLYSTDKLVPMWDNLIFFNPNNPEVWQEYLIFVISDLTTFNTSSILKLYNKCLKTLSNLCEGVIESHKPLPDIVSNMLGIFSQLCHILKSSGYTEKAIALFQALIEFNLFCNSSIGALSLEEKIACFEPFWDSGTQRIGEKNSKGWAETVQQKTILFENISTDSDLNNMEDDILDKKLPAFETWLEFERLREANHWLPWKPNPEYDQTGDDVDDMDRAVSFDDVSKFLFNVLEEDQKFLLIIHFLVFLGFDVHSLGCYYMGNRMTCNPISVDDYENVLKELKTSQLMHKQKNPICFDTSVWTMERFNFTDNIFLQVLDKFSQKYKILLTYMWLKFRKFYAVEVKNKDKEEIKNLKKFVKGILKKNENRNCLLLWSEYIHIEWFLDRSSAMKTFQTLLLSSTTAASSGNMQLQELWYFAQMFIDLNFLQKFMERSSSNTIPTNEVLWILLHIVSKESYVPYSNQEIKPTMILKSVSGFKSLLEKELSELSLVEKDLCYCINPCIYSVLNCAKCFVYFQYFSQGIEVALQVYESIVSFVESNVVVKWGQYLKEQICVAQADMLHYHTWNTTASIRPMTSFLYESVKKYPHNSKLLHMLVKLRSASSVISPTRRFLSQILKIHQKVHPIVWIFALVAEFAICHSLLLQSEIENEDQCLNDYLSSMGINWRIRSLYEQMLKSDMCAHIPILWRSYLKFEIMIQNTEKAKSIFHRALQNCGWSKALLMDGVEYFPDQFNQILAFMTEKQIRIHTPLEEVTLLMEHAVADS